MFSKVLNYIAGNANVLDKNRTDMLENMVVTYESVGENIHMLQNYLI